MAGNRSEITRNQGLDLSHLSKGLFTGIGVEAWNFLSGVNGPADPVGGSNESDWYIGTAGLSNGATLPTDKSLAIRIQDTNGAGNYVFGFNSSGVFLAFLQYVVTNTAAVDKQQKVYIKSSSDNGASYTTIGYSTSSNSATSEYNSGAILTPFKISDTANDRIKITYSPLVGNSRLVGAGNPGTTQITFLKLASI